MDILDFIGPVLGTIILSILILYRRLEIQKIRNTLQEKKEEIWQSVMREIPSSHSLAKNSKLAVESFTNYFDSAEKYTQDKFTKSVFLNSYLSILFFGSIFELILTTMLPITEFSRIIILDSLIIPILFVLCLDVLSYFIDRFRVYLLGDVGILKLILLCGGLFLSLTGLVFITSYFIPRNLWNIALQSMFVFQAVVSIIPIAMKDLGANYWKIETDRINEIRKNCTIAMECAVGVFLLEDTHRVTSLIITEFLIEYEKDLFTQEEINQIFSEIKTEIQDGLNLLNGIDTSIASNQVKAKLQNYYRKSFRDFRIKCYESYLNSAEEILSGKNKIQRDLLRLSFAFVNNEYLQYLVDTNSPIFSNDSQLISSLGYTVGQHHSPIYNQMENELLSRIAFFVVKEGIQNGQIRMGNVTSSIEVHSPHVEKVVGYIEYISQLHQNEHREFKQPTNLLDVARIIYSVQGNIDDAVLRLIYESIPSKSINFDIAQACRSDIEQSQDERLRWMIRFLRNTAEDDKKQIVLPIILWLENFRLRDLEVEAFAKIIFEIIPYDQIESDQLGLILGVVAKLLDNIENYKERMNLRFSIKESSEQPVDMGTIDQRLFSTNEKEIAVLLLSIYGMKYYVTEFPEALAESTEVLLNTLSFQPNGLFLDEIYKAISIAEKQDFLKVLFIELSSFPDSSIVTIKSEWQEFLNAVVGPITTNLETFPSSIITLIRTEHARIRGILESYNYLSNQTWIEKTKGLVDTKAKAWSVVLATEPDIEKIVFALGIAISNDYVSAISFYQKIKSHYRIEDSFILSMLRYWNFIDYSSDQYLKVAKNLLIGRAITPRTDDVETISSLNQLLEKLVDCILTRLFAPILPEIKSIKIGNCISLYGQTKLISRDIDTYLLQIDYLLKGVLHVFTYLVNYKMVSLERFDEIIMWDRVSEIIANKDESRIPQITFVLINDLMSDMVTGGHNTSYLIFLQAVTTNNIPGSIGLVDLDKIAREKLSDNDDALAFANLFSFIHKQGQNPLALSFSELLMDLKEREKLAKVDNRFREEWVTSHNLLKVRINEEEHWVDRLRFLDPELKKIREAQTQIESLSEQLEQKAESAKKAASIANQLLNIQIDDKRIIEYISKRTYNYFLISWSTPRRFETDEQYETFGNVIDDWLKNRKEFYGLTVKLGNSTRVGKIPRGMTFEEFKRLIGRDLMNLRETHGINPQVFITCWSPSIHSAHALLGEETLQMDPITAIRTTFRKGSIELANEPIDRFIEESLFGQASMIDSIAALNESAANPMSFWEKDPIEFMIKIAVLSDDTNALFGNQKYKEKMAILYERMKGSNSLEQLALKDGKTLATIFIDDVFKGYHKKTKDDAIKAAGEMIDTLRIVLLLKTDR